MNRKERLHGVQYGQAPSSKSESEEGKTIWLGIIKAFLGTARSALMLKLYFVLRWIILGCSQNLVKPFYT